MPVKAPGEKTGDTHTHRGVFIGDFDPKFRIPFHLLRVLRSCRSYGNLDENPNENGERFVPASGYGA